MFKEFLARILLDICRFVITILCLAMVFGWIYQKSIDEQNAQLQRIEEKLDAMITLQKMEMGIYEKDLK